jgi:hypothetical protein
MLLERVLHFDAELILLRDRFDEMPADLVFSRGEFDLASGLKLVLNPFREFTKWAQFRNKVTVAYVPVMLDRLVETLSPHSFDASLRGRADFIFPHIEALQQRLCNSLKLRFAPVFEGSSLALAARYLLPGGNLFEFTHFPLAVGTLQQVLLLHLLLFLPSRSSRTSWTTMSHSFRATHLWLTLMLIEASLPPSSLSPDSYWIAFLPKRTFSYGGPRSSYSLPSSHLPRCSLQFPLLLQTANAPSARPVSPWASAALAWNSRPSVQNIALGASFRHVLTRNLRQGAPRDSDERIRSWIASLRKLQSDASRLLRPQITKNPLKQTLTPKTLKNTCTFF